MSSAPIRLMHKRFDYSVSVGAIADVEVHLRVRLSARVVKLIISRINNVHSRRPSNARCNAQAKNERFHSVIFQHKICLCALLTSL